MGKFLWEQKRPLNLRVVIRHLMYALFLFSLPSCRSNRIVDIISPLDDTRSTLEYTYIRVQKFWNENGKVPMSANELPEEPHHDCSMADGWGRDLFWQSDGVSIVRIWSLGKDGKLGGAGDDVDLEIVFEGKQRPQDEFPTITPYSEKKSSASNVAQPPVEPGAKERWASR
jgi:hypothetical protein